MTVSAGGRSAPFTQAALDYFDEHGITPAVAERYSVREDCGALVFPWSDIEGRKSWRRRSLNGKGPRWRAEGGHSPGLWWPTGRPERSAVMLVCEGGSDALAALSAANYTEDAFV